MRISDWSSDVCSSDLLVPKIGTTAARLTSAALQAQSERRKTPPLGGRLREGAESYAKLAQIAGARSYLLLPSTVAPERRRLSSIRRWLRILTVSGPTRRYSMKPRERQNRSAASFASSPANRITVAQDRTSVVKGKN